LVRAYAKHAAQTVTPSELAGNDVADSAQDQGESDVMGAVLGKETDQLFEMDCALQRISDGTYGLCEATGQLIPAERLRAVPWTRYSLAAAQAIEQRPQTAKNHAG